MQRCALCGAENPDIAQYCAACGQRLAENSATPAGISAAGATSAVSQPAPRPLALAVGYASDRGLVRDLDEDSLLVFTLAGVFESRAGLSLGLFIVADGMGGHEGGELASKQAVGRIADVLIENVLLPLYKGKTIGGSDGVKQLVQGAVIDANYAVHGMAAEKGIDAGTTVTLALIADGEAHIANVGDSRTFLFREGKLRQVTQDHSLVASMVLAGALRPDEIYTHPQRNVVYRSLGAHVKVEVDQFYELLQPGDALVLCCDGIWETVRPKGIEEVLLAVADPQAACNELVRRGNAAGGDDNLSVIVVRVNP
ncbi:MAG: protein phosphatase 2C domain-containing protein [Nitrososphaerales archaeon]